MPSSESVVGDSSKIRSDDSGRSFEAELALIPEAVRADRVSKRSERQLRGLLAATAAAILMFDLSSPLGSRADVPYVFLVLMTIWARERSTILITAVGCTCLALLGLVNSPESGSFFTNVVDRGLVIVAVWATATLCLLNRRLAESQSHATWLRLNEEQENQSLRNAQERLHQLSAIVESSDDAIITKTLDGTITSWNAGAEHLYGFTADEMIGQLDTKIIPADRLNDLDDVLLCVRRGERTKHFETRRKHKDGTLRDVSLNLSPLRDANGEVVGISGIARDITDQKLAEQERNTSLQLLEEARKHAEHQAEALRANAQLLEAAQRRAEEANQAKSEFLANMSHELRTPLTAILGFTEMLLGSMTRAEDTDAGKTIQRNGQYLVQLIDDILDLSKIEAGKINLEIGPCSPMRIVHDVIELMKVRADAKGLKLTSQVDGAIPEHIQTDPTRLRQILLNLLSNAVKFTEFGQVTVKVSLDQEAAQPRLRFDVLDTGIGMSESRIAVLFRPFTQADSSMSRKQGGTGLGLTISKRLIELLNGSVDVVSQPGKGSHFTVWIATGVIEGVRLLAEDEALASTAKPEPQQQRQGPVRTINARVLLAEDGPDNQRLISFLLKKAGAEVALAENGAIAVQMATDAEIEGNPFGVVLMDMQMPVMDGYAATRQLRERDYPRPIIALTAHAMKHDRQRCLEAGCDDYATKPIDRRKLLDIVASFAAHGSGSECVNKIC